MHIYHIARNGDEIGQMEEEGLIKKAAEGFFLPNDLVWTAGMPQWEPIETLLKARGIPLLVKPVSTAGGIQLDQRKAPVTETPKTMRGQAFQHESEESSSLWSPFGCAVYGFFLGFPFGAMLISKNWTELGEHSRAQSTRPWIYSGLFLMFLMPIGSSFFSGESSLVLAVAAWLIGYALWMLKSWNEFRNVLERRRGLRFQRRPFTWECLKASGISIFVALAGAKASTIIVTPETLKTFASFNKLIPAQLRQRSKSNGWSKTTEVKLYNNCISQLAHFHEEVSNVEVSKQICACATGRICGSMTEHQYLTKLITDADPLMTELDTCIKEGTSASQ
jgi:hypothetical protein